MTDKSNEIWRKVPSFPDYEASSLGRIRRATRKANGHKGGLLKPWQDAKGHVWITVMKDKRKLDHREVPHRPLRAARMVCEAFHGRARSGKNYAIQIDGNRANLRPENLMWGTHPAAKLTVQQARRLKKDLKLGAGRTSVAKHYGLSTNGVGRIARGESFKGIE